jgi:hypothetical protein
VPSWAKEENQWELDQKAGEAEGDKNKKVPPLTYSSICP